MEAMFYTRKYSLISRKLTIALLNELKTELQTEPDTKKKRLMREIVEEGIELYQFYLSI